MTNFKKFLISGVAITMAFGMAALAGCVAPAPEAKDFTFEAEEATLTENDDNVACYQEVTEYGAAEGADTIEIVGYFTAADANIIWTIQSSHECDATLTLRAASTAVQANIDSSGEGPYTATTLELDMSTGEYATLTVNDVEVSFTGTLPGIAEKTFADAMTGFGEAYGGMMNNYGTVTAKIHLKKGENVIALTSLGYVENNINYGLNVDKITINAASNLTWTPEDNTDRAPAQMG